MRAHTIPRPVAGYRRQSGYPRLVARLRELCHERRASADIAGPRNATSTRRSGRRASPGEVVRRLTVRLGLSRRPRHGGTAGLGPDESRPTGRARRLGVGRDTVRQWLRAGWLTVRDEDGHQVIWADADELCRLRELRDLPRTWANRKRLAHLKKPKPRPAR